MRELLVRLGAQFAPLLTMRGEATLDRWVAAHRETIEAIASTEDDDEDREALDTLFDELAQNAQDRMTFDAESYGLFFAAVAGEVHLRGAAPAHPRLQILGLLEARLIDTGVILACRPRRDRVAAAGAHRCFSQPAHARRLGAYAARAQARANGA